MPAISRMQFHAVEFPASGLTVDINLTHAVDQSRTAIFIVPYMFPAGPTHSPDRAQAYPTFVNNSTVRLTRVYSGIYGDTYYNNVWVVEFDSAYVNNVQRGTFDPTSANTDIPITSVDTSYALPLVHCATINSPHASWTAYFTSSTNLRVQSNGLWSAGEMPGSYQIIEFASANMRPIQAISSTLVNSGTDALETHDITIPTALLDDTKTFVGCHAHWDTGYAAKDRAKFTCEIPNLTTVRLKRWGSTGFQPTVNLRLYVVEMTDNSRVRYAEHTVDVTQSTEDYTWLTQDSGIAFSPMIGFGIGHHRRIADNTNANRIVGHQLFSDTVMRRHATSNATEDSILCPQFVEIIEGGGPVTHQVEAHVQSGEDTLASVALVFTPVVGEISGETTDAEQTMTRQASAQDRAGEVTDADIVRTAAMAAEEEAGEKIEAEAGGIVIVGVEAATETGEKTEGAVRMVVETGAESDAGEDVAGEGSLAFQAQAQELAGEDVAADATATRAVVALVLAGELTQAAQAVTLFAEAAEASGEVAGAAASIVASISAAEQSGELTDADLSDIVALLIARRLPPAEWRRLAEIAQTRRRMDAAAWREMLEATDVQ